MSVVLAYVHPGSVPHMFLESVVRTLGHDREHRRISGTLPIRFRPAGICDARNQGVGAFLSTNAEWLWFVDTDMGFGPDTLPRLLEVADPENRPVVGALCYGVREEEADGFGGFRTRSFPTLYAWSDSDDSFVEADSAPGDALLRVDGTGAACLLIHRSALEKVGSGWFDTFPGRDGEPMGEDLSFCLRLRDVRIPVHVHTGIRTSHQKTQWIS